MFGLTRKKAERPTERPSMPMDVPPTPIDEAAGLSESFRALEIATLTLDGIAHGLGEARMLARSAARPDGAAQRGLIAARYAFLREDIERRSSELALSNGEEIAIALAGGAEGRRGSLAARALPSCAFSTAEECRALTETLEHALRAVEEEATHIREAAGHIADRLPQLTEVMTRSVELPPMAGPAPFPVEKPASSRKRRAA
jgi:hypothetical protein